jgi:hypothetical protein
VTEKIQAQGLRPGTKTKMVEAGGVEPPAEKRYGTGTYMVSNCDSI